jgi:hypothetical protein
MTHSGRGLSTPNARSRLLLYCEVSESQLNRAPRNYNGIMAGDAESTETASADFGGVPES